MLNRIAVVALGITLFAAVPQAHATDPCDPAVMTQMSTSATKGFQSLSDIAVTLMQPSPPAASSNCMRDLFNIWKIDPAMILGALFPSGTLGYTLGGFTLTQSSPAAIVIGYVNTYFNSKFGNMICGELWQGIGKAMAPISFLSTGGIKVDPALLPVFGGALGGMSFSTGFGTTISWK